MSLPRFFMDNDSLGGIWTVGWVNNPLAKPGAQTFAHLSLELPQNCPVWEVHRVIGACQNSIGQSIAVTQVLTM